MLIHFNTSPKRENLLIHIVERKRFSEERKKVLIGDCRTRWSEKDVSYERFYEALPLKLLMVPTQRLTCLKKFISKARMPKAKLKLLSS